jgi:hypothetical protein
MKLFTTIFTIFLCGSIFSQVNFEKGYYVDNKGDRHDCFIKFKDWNNNPSKISYKNISDDEESVLSIDNISEFGINNKSKYVRYEIEYDTSKVNSYDLDYESEPKYKRVKVFLKVLTEGAATLFAYTKESYTQFYYILNDSKIIPLVYKKYYKNDESSDDLDKTKTILNNEKFKQQLWFDLKCSDQKIQDVEIIEYNAKSLIGYFESYNQCQNSNFHTYKEKGGTFKFFLNIGVENANMNNFRSDLDDTNFSFNNIYGYKFGLGLEYYLPFGRNKWAFTLIPEFDIMQAEASMVYEHWVLGVGFESTDVTIESNYNNFKLPFGFRHYFYFNDKSKLFLNFNYYYLFRKNRLVTFSHEDFPDLNFENSTNGFYIGAGITLFSRVSATINFEYRIPSYSIMQGNYFWTSTYNAVSFNLSYMLF